ncbi:HET-domain-containing protein, partial [Teratosphaeria nubilosa]
MRLLNTTDYTFRTFNSEQLEPYAILSHCWSQDPEQPELTYQDVLGGAFSGDSPGWRKIEQHCRISRARGFAWAWVDTCCIDKRDSVELSEAINSMFAWYRDAAECYVFLLDVDIAQVSQVRSIDMNGTWRQGLDRAILRNIDDFCASRWFLRGWTLQELLAPSTTLFYNQEFQLLGTKEELAPMLSYATGIEVHYLTGTANIQEACVAQRMSWAAQRATTRTEDMAYCLLGIFNVNMPLLYGEGNKAFIRLQIEIINCLQDASIFAW